MTRHTDDPSLGTALTDKDATALEAVPGRGAHPEPGAGEPVPEDADALEPATSSERLVEGDDPKTPD